MRHSKTEITARAIQLLKNGGRLYDHRCNGLGVRKTAGGASYFFRWRVAGQLRELALGRCDSTTFSEALRKARAHRAAIDDCRDPIDEARSRRETEKEAAEAKAAEATRFAARLTLNDFFPTYARLTTKKPSSRRSDASIYWNHVGPFLGHLFVEEIRPQDVQRLHDKVSEVASTRANRVNALVSHMLTVAARRGLRPGPLPRGTVQKNPEAARERFLTPAEHKRIWSMLTAMEETSGRDAAQALKLLIVTGCRKNEIVALRWDEVEEHALALKDSKTGKRRVPLTDLGRQILTQRSAERRSDWVFPNEKLTGPRSEIDRFWRMARQEARLDELRIHDLRHAFASLAVSAGLSGPEIGKLLGHKAAATTQRYMHLADEAARAAADKVGARMTSIFADLRAVS